MIGGQWERPLPRSQPSRLLIETWQFQDVSESTSSREPLQLAWNTTFRGCNREITTNDEERLSPSSRSRTKGDKNDGMSTILDQMTPLVRQREPVRDVYKLPERNCGQQGVIKISR